MKKLTLLSTIILIILLVLPETALGIPAFARKYGFNCNMCHAGFTRLNDFGQRYRDNGYQIPGQEGGEKTVFDNGIPVAMRLSVAHETYNNEQGTSQSFTLHGLDFLAAGVLHKNISFLLIYTPRIDEPSDSYGGLDSLRSNPSQTAGLESVSLIFSNIIQDKLNLRIGRFEPGYHVFSSKRSYYLFEAYEVYTLTTANSSYVFDDNQIGIEATGHFKSGFKYAAGFINGNGAHADNNNFKDVYLNAAYTIGKGEGRTAGQQIGLFGYYGMQPTSLPGKVISPAGATNGGTDKGFYRMGATGSFNWQTWHLNLMYLKGTDDKAFNMLKPSEQYNYSGGFAEIDYAGLFNNRLIASALYNWFLPPDYDEERQVNAFSGLLRYYLGSWSAVNIAIHAEYTHRITGKEDTFKENEFALALDFAF